MEKKRKFDFTITGENDTIVKDVSECTLLNDWIDSLDDSIHVESIKIQNIKRNSKGEIEYLKLDTVNTRNGGKIPRIIMLEGHSIMVLVILISIETHEKYCLLTEEIQIPTGKIHATLPFEKTKGNFPTPEYVYEFLKRHCNFETDPLQYRDLIKEASNGKFDSIYPYSGPCDNKTHILLYEKELPTDEIMKLNGKEIRLNVCNRIFKLENIYSKIHDFVSLSAFLYYDKHCEMLNKDNK